MFSIKTAYLPVKKRKWLVDPGKIELEYINSDAITNFDITK